MAEDEEDDNRLIVDNPRKYILPKSISFGYNKDYHSNQMFISEDGQSAVKESTHYAHGLVYSDRPLRGTCEFEVMLTGHGNSWSGNFKLGLVQYSAGEPLDKDNIPRYSPEGENCCVWCADKVHDHIHGRIEKKYGHLTLDELREGDRLGLQVTKDGVLSFFVNDEHQGVAVVGVHKDGYDLYALVDHYGQAKSTVISKAIMRVDSRSLQETCLDRIASSLSTKDSIEKLPLPNLLKEKLKLYVYAS